MPRKGHVFSAKEHRQVEHIKASEEQRGLPAAEAEAVGYATVVKHSGGKHEYTREGKTPSRAHRRERRAARRAAGRSQEHRLRDGERAQD